MNLPGSFGGTNWRWRYAADQLTDELAKKLRGLAEIYGRLLPLPKDAHVRDSE